MPFDPDELLEPGWRKKLAPVLNQMPELQTVRRVEKTLKGAQLADTLYVFPISRTGAPGTNGGTGGVGGDGEISSADSVFANLRLWQDTNHNGVSEPDELRALGSSGLESLSLQYKESGRRDRYGNQFRYRGKVYGGGRSDLGRWVYDVFLVTKPE